MTGLTEIIIPENVISIGMGTFDHCNLEKIIILNPKIEMNSMIQGGPLHDNLIVYGYENSTAQEYSEIYINCKFESLGKAPEKEITATGDINGDGDFSISDVVTIQKYLLGDSDLKISDWKQADFTGDGVLDVFDLCLMKKKLVEK